MFQKIKFTVKQEHIKLLREMYVGWQDCEFGAPEIDPKRPYGNSYVYGDIAEILDIKPEKQVDDDEFEFSKEQEAYMDTLHKETETVLQIFLATGQMSTGDYECERYGKTWEKIITPVSIIKDRLEAMSK